MSTQILEQKIGKTGYGLLGKRILHVRENLLISLNIRSNMETHNYP